MIHINGHISGVSFSPDDVVEWLEHVISDEIGNGYEISVSYVDTALMISLNERYTGREGTTDVLAFSQQDGSDPAPDHQLLGDVIIDANRVREQARQYGSSVDEELLRVTVHGVLHLLGYDHQNAEEESIMRDKEETHIRRFYTIRGIEG